MAASTTAITPASVAPVRVIPLGPDGSDIDSGVPLNDPADRVTRVADQAVLRGMMAQIIDGNTKLQERFDALLNLVRAQNAMLAEAFDYAGGPEAALTDASVSDPLTKDT